MSSAITLNLGDDGILVATMDLPGRPMNVVGEELMQGLAAAVERLEADHRQKSDHDRLRQVVACDFHGLQPPIAQRGRVQIGEALAPRGARVAQPRLGVRRRT